MKAPDTRSLRPSSPKLAVQLMLVLSIAILPLGLISVYQTKQLLNESRALSKSALLGQTQRAVSGSHDLIQSAISTAETLAAIVLEQGTDETLCRMVMEEVIENADKFVFAGYVDNGLKLNCTSDGQTHDLSATDVLQPELSSGATEIVLQPLAFIGPAVSLNVIVPVTDGDSQMGAILIALPFDRLSTAMAAEPARADFALFNAAGDIIATKEYTDDRRSVLPQTLTLAELAQIGQTTFRDENREGQVRDFAVVPIYENTTFALGSWEPRDTSSILPGYEEALALYFPFVMWAIAIVVAYVGVNRLVIRHVRRLRSWMRLHATGTGDLANARLDNAPEELEVVAEAFRAMVRQLAEHDAAREEDLREKTTLLREVHHRVKNNLQLISSIMNMQIRATETDESKRVLRRVQDRVMALSAIHRYLYLSRKLTHVRADKLLQDIIEQIVILGGIKETGRKVNFTTEIDPVEISPDQSVPLSLLATETAMNAVKYCGADDDQPAWVNLALKDLGEDRVCLSVVNSRSSAPDRPNAETAAETGFGARLISSFVSQLDGTLEVEEHPGRYEMHVTFTLMADAEEDG